MHAQTTGALKPEAIVASAFTTLKNKLEMLESEIGRLQSKPYA